MSEKSRGIIRLLVGGYLLYLGIALLVGIIQTQPNELAVMIGVSLFFIAVGGAVVYAPAKHFLQAARTVSEKSKHAGQAEEQSGQTDVGAQTETAAAEMMAGQSADKSETRAELPQSGAPEQGAEMHKFDLGENMELGTGDIFKKPKPPEETDTSGNPKTSEKSDTNGKPKPLAKADKIGKPRLSEETDTSGKPRLSERTDTSGKPKSPEKTDKIGNPMPSGKSEQSGESDTRETSAKIRKFDTRELAKFDTLELEDALVEELARQSGEHDRVAEIIDISARTAGRKEKKEEKKEEV